MARGRTAKGKKNTKDAPAPEATVSLLSVSLFALAHGTIQGAVD